MRQLWTRSPFISAAFALSTMAAYGCGVSDITKGLFAPEGEEGAGGGATTTSGSGGSSGTGGDSATSTSSGSQGGSGGAGGMSGTGGDLPTTTTSTGGPLPTLDCVSTTCPYGDDSACCYDNSLIESGTCVTGPPNSATCNTSDTLLGRRTRIECQTPSQCDADEVCCGTRVTLPGNNAYYSTVKCQSNCNGNDIVLCDPTDPKSCPIVEERGEEVQYVCTQSSLLPENYFVCNAPPPMP